MKQKIIFILRLLKLLKITEKLRSVYYRLKSIIQKSRFNKIYKNYVHPPFEVAYDAYADYDPFRYLRVGESHAEFISNLISKYKKNKDIESIYEWGCGPMRILRQLPSFFKNLDIKYYGSDYNIKTIEWAKENFKKFNIKKNNLQPPLPFKNNEIDVIYCVSVFTHLSELNTIKFIHDLHRILKKDGILIATFHGDMNSKLLLEDELIKYKKGEFIERGNVYEGSRIYTSFQPDKFIEREFKNFKILETIKCNNENQSFQQDWWVFQKK